jgi:hypothetical protein
MKPSQVILQLKKHFGILFQEIVVQKIHSLLSNSEYFLPRCQGSFAGFLLLFNRSSPHMMHRGSGNSPLSSAKQTDLISNNQQCTSLTQMDKYSINFIVRCRQIRNL